jgi:UPF0716 family protein affecting phage T7 exclusion
MFLEIFVSYEFTKIFTPFGMFIEILGSAVFGVILLRSLNLSLFEHIQKIMTQDKEFIFVGISQFIGAILLIVPGVFTDIIGVLMQFNIFGFFFTNKFFTKQNSNNFEDNIIDVEIIEEKR